MPTAQCTRQRRRATSHLRFWSFENSGRKEFYGLDSSRYNSLHGPRTCFLWFRGFRSRPSSFRENRCLRIWHGRLGGSALLYIPDMDSLPCLLDFERENTISRHQIRFHHSLEDSGRFFDQGLCLPNRVCGYLASHHPLCKDKPKG